MIVLDTNVVSELMRPSPSPAVEQWVATRPAASLFFSAVGEAELRYGVAILAAGRRRDPSPRPLRRCCGTILPDGYYPSTAPQRERMRRLQPAVVLSADRLRRSTV